MLQSLGEEGIVKLLLEGGDVDLDLPDKGDRTPLSYAAESGHEGLVGILLRRAHVNRDLPDCINRTPLAYVAWFNSEPSDILWWQFHLVCSHWITAELQQSKVRAFKKGNLGPRPRLLVAITCERVLVSTGPIPFKVYGWRWSGLLPMG